MAMYGITTYERICAFLAQVGHESGSLKYTEEIASGAAYEGRKDLGNTEVGDGKKFKGRGLIQITGRANYTQLAKVWNDNEILTNPTKLAEPELATKSACWWWQNRGLNALADIPTDDNFRKITKKINGGYNGYDDRKTRWQKIKVILK
jgi:predicted chitinase